MPRTRPEVSIIIPAYQSERTIARSLFTMQAQAFPDYEIVLVDSSPDDRTEEIVRTRFGEARYEHSPHRVLPYAARNRAVEMARGRLLAFTDPDIYASPSWLQNLVAAYRKYGGAITGAIACHGERLLEVGMHFCKFDMWLPGGDVRRVEIGATANMLCDRVAFETAGGFDPDSMLADTLMSWSLESKGIPIRFVPNAFVEHHHLGTWGSLLQERYARGKEFAGLRLKREAWSEMRVLTQTLASLIPLRLAKLTLRGAGNARRAKSLGRFLKVSPVVVSGQAAWLAGEAAAYRAWLTRARETS